jgi:ribonuclease P/MRP protein subunit POP5
VKYLSHATSTFILKIHRAHYRLLWAALTVMDHVPVKNGRPCIFRVVRVSGTIRRVEEEAVRQAKALVLTAKDQAANRGSAFLTSKIVEPEPSNYEDTSMIDVVDDSDDG